MLKRTKGRILLALLVITGMAGTVNESTLSNRERNFAVTQLKESRADILFQLKGLSDAQLNHRTSPADPSIRDLVYQLALVESDLWNRLKNSMKDDPEPASGVWVRLDDLQLVRMARANPGMLMAHAYSYTISNAGNSSKPGLADFKATRAKQLKYVKTTTADLRNHTHHLNSGKVDCYQLILLAAASSRGILDKIKRLQTEPSFPSK